MPHLPTPTARQTQVLACIDESWLKRWRGPSLKEIQRALKLPLGNVQGASDHLRALQKKGYVERREGEAYAVRLTSSGMQWVRRAK
jgi:repressor LexA